MSSRLAIIAAVTVAGISAHAVAAPMGNAIVSTAETLNRGEVFEDLSIVTGLGGGPTEVSLNSQYGIGGRTDIGFDIPLNGASRPLFSATHMAYSDEKTRIRLGALGLNSEGGEAAEIVLGRDWGETTLHAGVSHAFPGTVVFGGLTRALSPSATVHVEYVGGPDPMGAVGCEWSLGHRLNLITSALHDFNGDAGLYLDFIWTNAE
ncbi:MAG TPA: hypothetical protein QGH10_22070 [Armatimonadota bacterium]|nr:hypothetical protein [Armatimonadota bacterium]